MATTKFIATLLPGISDEDYSVPLIELIQRPSGGAVESLPMISVPSLATLSEVIALGNQVAESRWEVDRSSIFKLGALESTALVAFAEDWAKSENWGDWRAAPDGKMDINSLDLYCFLQSAISCNANCTNARAVVLDLEAENS